MKQSRLKNSKQVSRFAVVGLINTAIDFFVLFGLRTLGIPIVTANILSATTAFVFSFLANRRYTFKDSRGDIKRQIVLFIVVTLFGLWVIQNIVIYLTEPVLGDILGNQTLSLLVVKTLATGVSLIWNYVLYTTVVFRRSTA